MSDPNLAGGCLALADLEQPLRFEWLFPSSPEAPVEIEIGAGRGDFLVDYAKANPQVNLIGIERKLTVLRRAISKIQRAGLKNVVLINAEINYLFDNYMLPDSLQAIHVYFPDPWPKKRHIKRRLFQPHTPERFLKVLKAGGFVHLRTDVQSYFQTMLEIFGANDAFMEIEPSPAVLQFLTAYEKRFVAEGKPVFRTSYLAARKPDLLSTEKVPQADLPSDLLA